MIQIKNRDIVRAMSDDMLAEFLEDVENFDNPDHEWKSCLEPHLPFESWEDWLNREAIHG